MLSYSGVRFGSVMLFLLSYYQFYTDSYSLSPQASRAFRENSNSIPQNLFLKRNTSAFLGLLSRCHWELNPGPFVLGVLTCLGLSALPTTPGLSPFLFRGGAVAENGD